MTAVRLRPLEADDAETLARWGSDEAFRRAADWSVRSYDEYLARHRELIARPADRAIRLGVVDEAMLVGYVDLYPDLHPDGDDSWEVGIVVGPSSNWRLGYGRQAMQLAIRYAYDVLGARRILAETHETNAASRSLLEASGFVETGREGTDEHDGQTVGLIQFTHHR